MADSEVIVIGGGIAGASAAYHLAEQGRSVALLERGEVASEASGVNAGGIGAYGWGHVPNLEAYLTTGSLQIFKGLQFGLGYDIEFRQSGALQTIQTVEQFEYARNNVLTLKSQGYTVELLTVDEARSIEPELNPELKGAVHFPLRAQADPVKATRAFAEAARHLGAEVLTGREASAISRGPEGQWRVDCPGESLTARQLVLAAGAWCGPVGKMLGLRIPVVPVRGQMWATQPLPPRVFHSISAAESPLHWRGNPVNGPDEPPELTHAGQRRLTRHLYGRQTRDGEVIFGGDREVTGFDSTVNAGGIEVNFGHASEAAPVPARGLHQPYLGGTDAVFLGRKTHNRRDTPAAESVHRQWVGVIRFWQRADGGKADRRLHSHGSSSACSGRVRPVQVCNRTFLNNPSARKVTEKEFGNRRCLRSLSPGA